MSGVTARCPTCRGTPNTTELLPSFTLRNAVSALTVRCRHGVKEEAGLWVCDDSGCQVVLSFPVAPTHESSCEFGFETCAFAGCGASVRRRDLAAHNVESAVSHAVGERAARQTLESRLSAVEAAVSHAASAASGASLAAAAGNSVVLSRVDALEAKIVGRGVVHLRLFMAGEAGMRAAQDVLVEVRLDAPLSTLLAAFANHVGVDARSLRLFHSSRPLQAAVSALAQGLAHGSTLTDAYLPPPPPPPAPKPAPSPAAASPASQSLTPRHGGVGGARTQRAAASAAAAEAEAAAAADGRLVRLRVLLPNGSLASTITCGTHSALAPALAKARGVPQNVLRFYAHCSRAGDAAPAAARAWVALDVMRTPAEAGLVDGDAVAAGRPPAPTVGEGGGGD